MGRPGHCSEAAPHAVGDPRSLERGSCGRGWDPPRWRRFPVVPRSTRPASVSLTGPAATIPARIAAHKPAQARQEEDTRVPWKVASGSRPRTFLEAVGGRFERVPGQRLDAEAAEEVMHDGVACQHDALDALRPRLRDSPRGGRGAVRFLENEIPQPGGALRLESGTRPGS